MKVKSLCWLSLAVVCVLAPITLEARGRGGGRGGMSRGGGGSISRGGGGYSRPSSYSRSPSMSRSAPSYSQRPSPSRPSPSPAQSRTAQSRTAQSRSSISRQPGATQGFSAVNRGGAPVAGGRPSPTRTGAASSMGSRRPPTGTSAFQSQRSYQQPSRNQLNSFLNGGGSAGASGRPSGEPRTYETKRGSTITVGGGSRSGTTEGGTTIGGAAGGIQIETARGNTYTKGVGGIGATDGQNSAFAAGSRTGVETAAGGSAAAGRGVRGVSDGTNTAIRAGGAAGIQGAAGNTVGGARGAVGVSDGTNSAVRGGSVTGARDTAGNAAVNVRGGYADSSGYRQGASVTARQNQWGYASVNARAGYGVGGTGAVATRSAVRGPAGNVISGGRGAQYINGQFVGGRAYTAVNGNFTRWGYFTPGYYGRYPRAWFPGKWAIVGTAWATTTWAVAGSYCGCASSGTYYDYEDNVTYEDGLVMYEDQPIATEKAYYEQADAIADAGAEPQDEEWLPLGVFAVIANADQTQTDKVVQLALNREGIIRGNYQDMLTEEVTPVTGSVDKETELVALKFEGNDSVIIEMGLYNLTNDEVPALVHFDATRREPRTLIRLTNPEEGQSQQ